MADLAQSRSKKSLGQHFLCDAAAARRIIAIIPAGASVLEIGPGTGALTEGLLQRAGRLTVIEKDDDLAEQWRQRALITPKLAVVHGDVLKRIEAVVHEQAPQWIIGNLPYNISGPLTALLAGLVPVEGMILMYQREVAERLLAAAGSKAYGGLSVLVRHHYRVTRLLTLPPGAFVPPPKVFSTVVSFAPHGRQPLCSYAALQRVVRQGFAHRRKTVANNFRGLLSQGEWRQLGIAPSLRPEQLDYEAWVRIAMMLGERG